MTEPIDIVVTDSAGKNRTVRIQGEQEAVEFLAATHAKEAPISFLYQDGSSVESKVVEGILKLLFSRMAAEGTENQTGTVRVRKRMTRGKKTASS